ncbi:MAG: alpha/beta hydrolase [Oscillospiraceae bacterium]
MKQVKSTSVSIKWKASAIVLAVCLAVMIAASAVGHMVQTGGGSVRTEEITFATDVGAVSHAKLYIPDTATAENPAPAILLCHGYSSTLDAMEPNAIELSRRGYVVMALDLYGHGESELPLDGYSQAEMGNVVNYAPDLGTYSALQEFAGLDYVDRTKIGMLGHSMGSAAIQEGAYIAYAKWQAAYSAAYTEALGAGQDETSAAGAAYMAAMNAGIVLPGSIVLTGYNYNVRNINDLTYNGVTAENGVFPLYAAPVNMCTIQATHDEFSGLLWGVEDSSQYTSSFKFAYGTGGALNVPSGTYFLYGDASAAPLSREEAAAAAASAAYTMTPVRAAYSFDGTHSDTYYDENAISYGIDFFDITLRGGSATLDPTDQIWHGRAACGLIGLLAALAAFVALALTLLRMPFFATIVRPESKSITTCDTPGRGVRYAIIYIICLLPAPLLYYWLVGYPYYMQPQWFMFLTKFMPNSFFNMAPMNSLMLFNGVIGVILLAVYLLVFFFIAKKAGCGLENTGLKLPMAQVLKSLLLAVVSFGVIYAVVYACSALSGTEFSFFKFDIMPMNGERWIAFLKYLPVWLFFFLLVSVLYNSFTRINNAPAWLNYVLIAVASCGGLAIMFAYDYGKLFATGVRGIPYIPGTTSQEWLSTIGMSFPTAFAGILLFGLLFILPITAVMSRVCAKKTGAVWLGGFLTALIALAFTISHMVISM